MAVMIAKKYHCITDQTDSKWCETEGGLLHNHCAVCYGFFQLEGNNDSCIT